MSVTQPFSSKNAWRKCFFSITAFSISIAVFPSYGIAQYNGGLSDVGCLVVALDIARDPDPDTKRIWSLGVTYFLGRAQVAHAGTPMISLIRAEKKRLLQISSEQHNRERKKCAELYSSSGDLLINMGTELRK